MREILIVIMRMGLSTLRLTIKTKERMGGEGQNMVIGLSYQFMNYGYGIRWGLVFLISLDHIVQLFQAG